ncbi:MAG: hypothetical protein HC768_01605 [Acaryochloris sp. CRU_2_0]|nr:hypothetical protein [Acaryochloris sp. CRU_2_0]
MLANQFHNLPGVHQNSSEQYRNTIALLSKMDEEFAGKFSLSTLYCSLNFKYSSSSRGCGKCGKTEKSTLSQAFKASSACGKPVEKIG